MSSSSFHTPTVALFGGTGGCGLVILRYCVQAGLRLNILARTPSKLPPEFLADRYPNLSVIQGDIRDSEAVQKTLIIADGKKVRPVDIVVSGLGMASGFSTPTLCEDGMSCILASIAEIKRMSSTAVTTTGPKIVAISTTGISTAGRDLPLVMVLLYRLFLGIPHADKRRMEALIVDSGMKWCIVRASMLHDGESKGQSKVRVGVEVPNKGGRVEVKKEIGYTICREDVGLWIFEELVSRGGNSEWEGKIVSLTH
jgi:nucleoside-diphosphate-sugar epimerase